MIEINVAEEIRETMASKTTASQKIRLRLTIYIPVIMAMFMLMAAFLVLYLRPYTFFPSDIPIAVYRQSITGWIYLMTAFGLIAGTIVGWGMSRNLKELIKKAEHLVAPGLRTKTGINEMAALNEIDSLGNILDKANISLNKFIQDSYILDALSEAVVNINSEGVITGLNKKGGNLLGLSLFEAKGKKLHSLIPKTEINRLFYNLIDAGIKRRKISSREVTIYRTGKERQTLWVGVSQAGDETATSPGDITITFKNPGDIMAIRNHFQRLEQLAALGMVASGMAHELRNPLGAIRGLTELIGENLPPDDQKMIYINEVLNQVDRLNRLMEEILFFSRGSCIGAEEVEINPMLDQSITLVQYAFPHKEVKVSRDYQVGLPTVMADGERLSRAFINLITNAFDAAPDGGWVNINTMARGSGEFDQGMIIINISDFGAGISPADIGRIFAPFYTTKKNGTGLGLTLSLNIIKSCGGNIEVYSQPGKGTTFEVTLPAKATPEFSLALGGARDV